MIRTFLIRLGFAVLPFMIVVATINYSVDPANIFSKGNYLSGIANILSQGHNVENVSNYDERLLQVEMVNHLKQAPDLVVVGSSRIMELGAGLFPGKTLLNCAVSHANIKDIIAITGILDSMHRLPDEIILNVDEGLVSKNYTDEWKGIRAYYEYLFAQDAEWVQKNHHRSSFTVNEKIFSIFSVSYFQSAILYKLKKKQKEYVDVGKKLPEQEGRLSDGTIYYSYDYTHGSITQIAQVASESGRKNAVGLPDQEQEKLLEFLLDYYRRKGIRVSFCMMPYHPAYYSNVNKYQNGIFIDYETYYRKLAAKYGITIIGSYDPGVQNLNDSMFYDMYHCSRTAIEKIFKR